ncbi:MAG: hypothetical protein UT24_C0004G0077 [Candidatus Woesebacteria bacterium GW2011_GWB1_39_12]|uniref:Metallopeptidase family protein n=2 Tax=Candidatus Woeseibacteriota TaxID=1752722 RepID=A0A0G0PK10_9BACT|nr:MAG: hypothetical protein UT23_C0003G0081 [Candidatus Woesebacteria bacterium GW2011_GWA1_39_12]KKR01514.1 MAG: hypothetical protein UT24_C0004G0077 [Candidatus Woesebacteria bacterium GW2011_GWB1_39_12]
MEDKDFEELVSQALDYLPQEFLEKLENLNVTIADWPTPGQIGGRGGLLLGLYEGVPQTRRGRYGIGGVLPDKITIFKIPILMISRSLEDIRENVRDTVIHEIAHHFGFSEEGIIKAKREKRKNL